jgi:large subunit ribosomal protein L21
MSYAVINDRGQQYTVKPGTRMKLALRGEEPGAKVVFDHVLLLGGDAGTHVGTPELAGARVEGTVLRHGLEKKVIVFKKKRRKGYRRKQGHRQGFTEVRIDAVHGA